MSPKCPQCGQHPGAEGFLEGAVQRGGELIAEVEALKARLQGIAKIARETSDPVYCRRLIIDATNEPI